VHSFTKDIEVRAMDREELEIHLENIANGRDEDQHLEWKRQWWDLKASDGKDEFRRDITAMANGSHGDISGYILIGAKGAKLHDAGLPRDEADLQEIISQIEPIPTVALEEHKLKTKDDEITLSVIEIKTSIRQALRVQTKKAKYHPCQTRLKN
jgi:hypothetical protein